MTYPATMLLPSVSVYVDGTWVADGSTETTDPQVMTDLVVRWGRSTVVDQPQPSTCGLTLLDQVGGGHFLDTIMLGMRLDVVADALLAPDPGPSTGVAVIDETFTGGPGNAYVQGKGTIVASSGVLTLTSTGDQAVSVLVPPGAPQPVGGNPAAWDTIPRAAQGQTWYASMDVKLPAPVAGYSGWAVQVTPLTYDSPWDTATALAELDTRADLGNGWVRVSGEFVPPTGVWLGVAVRLWPIGPAWDELDDSTWDQLPGPVGTRTNRQPDPRFTSTSGKTKSAGSANNATASLVTGITDHPAGITTAYRGTVVAAVVGVSSWYVGTSGVVQAPVEGDWYRAGAWVRMNVGHVMYLRIVNVSGSGSTNGPITDVPANTWTWLTVSGKVGPNTTALTVIAGVNSGPDPAPGVTQDMSGLVIEYFGTDQAAAAVPVTPADYFDGATPDTGAWDYAWTGTANASTSTATGLGVAATWDSLGQLALDNVTLKAPPAGAVRTGMVFSGRITDMVARYDGGATLVDLTAADQRAELGNRDVGDQPWLEETLGSRFSRIVTASGQPIESRVSATAAAYLVSWRDVDRQPAITLLSELATSADGVLWAATHPTTGPYLLLESLADREAMYVLTKTGGVIVIRAKTADEVGGIDMDACDVLLDPVRWRHDVSDMATRVSVTWREQTLDDKGQPAPTDRVITTTNPQLETDIGVHRVSVGTQLSRQTDAALVADAVLARTSNTQWRVSGLDWRADTTDQLDADALGRMMTLLDGTTRNGLPILLTNTPEWSPIPQGQDVPLYLEGGTYTSTNGGWELSLLVSSARAQGQGDVRWDDIPDGADVWAWDQVDPSITWNDLHGVGIT